MTSVSAKKTELLAPARNAAAGMAAISCGADAVYIGARRFGARADAWNSIEEIETLAAYAHRYYARVYITLNTILYDRELPRARRLIAELYSAGVDALIIQDVGLLELDLPPLPLFASTQMHNTTPEKVRFLEQVGFQRVILARELNIDQISEIRKSTTVDLESFVHGALCVSYSGRCYMSYAVGGRSGNRGDCAQPCRKGYSLLDGDGNAVAAGRYPLSLKDMNRSDYLAELLKAGIGSFKIEGRLKETSYVINTVAYYRQRLDRLLDGKSFSRSSSGITTFDFTPNPDKTFNRGYTDFGINGNTGHMASSDTPKARGEIIGVVKEVGRDHFILSAPHNLVAGDGICFLDHRKELKGSFVNGVVRDKIYPAKMKDICANTVICRNHDHRFVRTLEKTASERRISIVMILAESKEGFSLEVTDEDGNRAVVHHAALKQRAQDMEQAGKTMRKQLLKLGDSGFVCTDLTLDLAENYFLPVSALNGLRRNAIEALTATREKNRPRKEVPFCRNSIACPEKSLSFEWNVLNCQAEAFYRRHGVTAIAPAAETGLDMSGKKVMTTKYCILGEINLCGKRMQEPLYLIDDEGHRFRLHFNCEACEMEIFAA